MTEQTKTRQATVDEAMSAVRTLYPQADVQGSEYYICVELAYGQNKVVSVRASNESWAGNAWDVEVGGPSWRLEPADVLGFVAAAAMAANIASYLDARLNTAAVVKEGGR